VASGSAITHCGLLSGLRALGDKTPVTGICVRRNADVQTDRVTKRIQDLADLIGMKNPVAPKDLRLDDSAFAPGYGQLSDPLISAMQLTARTEGLILDPVYTGKVMAGLLAQKDRLAGKRVLFWHTGGQPALFAYADLLDAKLT